LRGLDLNARPGGTEDRLRVARSWRPPTARVPNFVNAGPVEAVLWRLKSRLDGFAFGKMRLFVIQNNCIGEFFGVNAAGNYGRNGGST
jgi:hypothetical protein